MGSSLKVSGSLLAENTVTAGSAAPVERPSNCDPAAPPSDGGGNVADTADCGFATAVANPALSSALVAGLGETPVLTIPSTSPAVDIAGDCTATDQRDLARPQGSACDAGAYEVAAPVIDAGPSGLTTSASASFAFSSPDPGTTFECRLDGLGGAGPWEACTSPKAYPSLAAGTYTFYVRPVGASAQVGRAFTVASPPRRCLRHRRPRPSRRL